MLLDRDFNAAINLMKQIPSAGGEFKPVDYRNESGFTQIDRVKQELLSA